MTGQQIYVGDDMKKALKKIVTESYAKPEGYEKDVGDYGPLLFDGWCGEPVAWGFKITRHLGDRFEALRAFGRLECLGVAGDWGLIVERLTREQAIAKYGAITEEDRGPRGGFRSVTFGTTKFLSRELAQ